MGPEAWKKAEISLAQAHLASRAGQMFLRRYVVVGPSEVLVLICMVLRSTLKMEDAKKWGQVQ